MSDLTSTEYDLVIIGAGSGGIACANRAAMYGAKVLIVDYQDIGGTCVNRGCVPKKVMWNGANMLSQIKYWAPSYGFNFKLESLDFPTLRANREAYIERIRQAYLNGLNRNKITFVQGHGGLVDKNTVSIDTSWFDGNKQPTLVKAKRVLLTPGGQSTLGGVPGDHLGIHSDGFFELEQLPTKALVVGAGYIAVELAGVLNSFGVDTTLITRGDRPLRWADHDLTAHLVEEFHKSGLKHLPFSKIAKVEELDEQQQLASSNKYRVFITTTNPDGSSSEVIEETPELIWAIGRHPNTKNLSLGNTKVELDAQGFIVTNELNETGEANIYALGDVVRMPALTPAAVAAGRRLAERLFNNKTNWHFDHKLIPTVIFSHPAIGTVGLSETDAFEKFGKFDPQTNPNGVKVYKSNFTSMISAITDHRETCFMKLVVQGLDEKVIGLHGIGYGVDEMIQGFSVAMNMGATKADFDNTLAIHPTGSEEFVTMR